MDPLRDPGVSRHRPRRIACAAVGHGGSALALYVAPRRDRPRHWTDVSKEPVAVQAFFRTARLL